MGYATLADVGAYAAKRQFGATSIPSATQVAKFLTDTSAEIDGILTADGFALPVDPTACPIGYPFLTRLAAIGAWSKVEHAAQVSDDADRAEKLWQDARADLIAGRVSLYDVPRLGGENFARSQAAATPFFTRDMQL